MEAVRKYDLRPKFKQLGIAVAGLRMTCLPNIGTGDILEFFCIPVEGGKPRQINLGVHLLRRQRTHPDGTHIVFGSYGSTANFKLRPAGIWMMKNVLALDKK